MLSNSARFAFSTAQHTPICVIGGGSGGFNFIGQMLKQKNILRQDLRVFEPSKLHFYQPAWTMVASGIYDASKTVRHVRDVIHHTVPITEQKVTKINPDQNELITEDGSKWTYDQLIISSGVYLDWAQIKGAKEALEDPDCPVGSAYWIKYAEKFAQVMKKFQGGQLLFTEPQMPIKCGGAPQKVIYLNEDILTQRGIRNKTDINFYKTIDVVFPVAKYSNNLAQILRERKVGVQFKHKLIEIKPKTRQAVFEKQDTKGLVEVPFDALHIVPPHKCHTFVSESGLGDQTGFLNVDKETLQHIKYKNIWGLGDCANLPTSKTAAALLAQTPILIENLMYSREYKNSTQLPGKYDGYTSCPIFTGRNQLMLAEFLYNSVVSESFFIDQGIPRSYFYYLKKDVFPWVYWNLIPRGLWYGRKGILPALTRGITSFQ